MNANSQNSVSGDAQNNVPIDALAPLKERLAKTLASRNAVQDEVSRQNAQFMAQHRAQREAASHTIPIPSLRDLPSEPEPEPADSAQTPQNQANEPAANPPGTRPQLDANPLQPNSNPSQPAPTRRPFTPKHGPMGLLNQLPIRDQDRILALLDGNNTFHQVALALAQPPPDGLSLRVSDDMVRRFKKRHTLRLRLQHQADLAHEARATLADDNAAGHDLTEAAARLLKMELLEEAIRADHNLAQLTQLSAILHKHQQADLAARRLTLAEKKSMEGQAPRVPDPSDPK